MPPIAPLTRREAPVARNLRDETVRALATREVRGDVAALMESVTVQLNAALTEYDARGWLRRRFPPLREHRLTLRQWMLELRGAALRAVEAEPGSAE